MTKFEEYLKDAFSESINDVFRHNRKTNEAYKKLLDDYNQQFECIRKRLGEDENLIMEFEEIGNHRGVIDSELIYLQGMIDCVKLLEIVRGGNHMVE